MTVGIVTIMEGVPWGGSEELWYLVCKLLVKKGVKVKVSVKRWSDIPEKLSELEDLGVHILYRELPVRKRQGIIERVFRRLFIVNSATLYDPFRAFFGYEYDHVIINEGGFGDNIHFPLLISNLNQKGIKYSTISQLVRESGVYQTMEQLRTARAFYKKALTTFFVSYRNLELAIRKTCYSFPNAAVTYNPVSNLNINVAYPLNGGRISMACVARLDCTHKGQDILINSLASDELKDIDFILSLFGEGPDKDYLNEMIQFVGLKEKIKFEGFMTPDNIWKNHDVFILSSLYEGMPLALEEAMLAGRICIVTDVAGNSEWIEHGKNGFLAKAPNEKELVAVIKEAFALRELWSEIGKQARNTATRKTRIFPEAQVIEKILEKSDISNI